MEREPGDRQGDIDRGRDDQRHRPDQGQGTDEARFPGADEDMGHEMPRPGDEATETAER